MANLSASLTYTVDRAANSSPSLSLLVHLWLASPSLVSRVPICNACPRSPRRVSVDLTVGAAVLTTDLNPPSSRKLAGLLAKRLYVPSSFAVCVSQWSGAAAKQASGLHRMSRVVMLSESFQATQAMSNGKVGNRGTVFRLGRWKADPTGTRRNIPTKWARKSELL